ncbi:MAG: formylglycine-generating enzyme family protein, partial [bacterium]|nr:formylglycine-generating enzyme family protein [bacterium]
VEKLAREDPDPQVRGIAAELIGGEVEPVVEEAAAVGVTILTPRERVHEKDGTVLVYVPGGDFTLGADDLRDREKPIHRVRLSPFWLGKYPVTNEQYRRYLEANPDRQEPQYWNDKEFNQPQQPVVGVSWKEARAYCRWAGLELPSEAQWEAAARGPDGRRYPWGNEAPTTAHANFAMNEGRTTPVGSYPGGAGPYGTLDQAGNVWEWCADAWDEDAYKARKGRVDPVVKGEKSAVHVLRGGSWAVEARHLAATLRFRYSARFRFRNFGFRCVLPVGPER